jgi:hypothetical protein
MSLLKTLSRSVNTAVKLPFAMTWDLMSLGNMGEGASTTKVLREHQARKHLDDVVEIVEKLKKVSR